MSKPTFIHSNIVYHDHSTEYHIDARGNQQIDAILRACEKDQVDDIKPAEPAAKSPNLPFLVIEKLKDLNLYTLEEFEDKYRKAVRGGAPKLAEFLRRYKELEVFNFEDRNKKEIFEEMKTFFGEEMDFGYPNFAAYY